MYSPTTRLLTLLELLQSYRQMSGSEIARRLQVDARTVRRYIVYTARYCHLRHDLRTFRLDRIVALEPTERAFERPQDFDVLEHVLRSLAVMPGTEQVEVLLETSMEHAQEVIPSIMGTLEPSANGVIFRRAATQMEWITYFLICLDFPVRVIEPKSLRDRLQQIAEKTLQMIRTD